MKGVILAGGTGSRLDPLTRITNKHLLPVYDRPMVFYAIEALREAGIHELMLVTGGEHVEDFQRLLGDEFAYGHQERAGGIAEALGLARDFAAGDRVVVMLADNIFAGSVASTVRNFEQQEEGARVVLAHVRETEHLGHLGVPRIEKGRIAEIVEKPSDPPSRLAVTGFYCYPPDVFDVVERVPQADPSGEHLVLAARDDPRPPLPRARAGRPLRLPPGPRAGGGAGPRFGGDLLRGHRR